MARPEDSRVKIPALVHFTRLGYKYMSIKKMVRGTDYDADTNIFYELFRESLNRVNGTELSVEDIKKIVEEMKIRRKIISLQTVRRGAFVISMQYFRS